MSLITVGISDLAVGGAPDVLATYALGSCVGICLYDKTKLIGGLAHIMLPNSSEVSKQQDNMKKFADSGIYLLLKGLEKNGAILNRLTAKIAGGAQMFAGVNTFNIGERNVASVKNILSKYNIPILAEQTGDKIGRTIFFDTKTGMLEVRSAARGSIVI
ncbi:MAG: chemotaxis protein CheD [Oscillospiraceae bacterium]|jgi:chemotaxis protein CheD